MTIRVLMRASAICGLTLALSACGGTSSGKLWPFGSKKDTPPQQAVKAAEEPKEETIWDLFDNKADSNVTVEVNKYLWQASLEVLSFLPIQSVDPFSGVIVTGYGTPPGGGRAYRATVLVQDPALDARSLKLSLESRGGQVSAETVRAVEDAILTRARQLRIRDSKL
ncbi:DUF3576 domain-containing protein [Paenirhodobacter sp. CAU 1674]|uniref:DUF3576 domain-containing protein n=1 Tax=Paenirhodobacter sp. CAU 1674 TaxID=3032596 RepID=UPI0023DAF8B4|nr:DUF3576 domain-containing protein [Paenirhodobacter sp. CAU 1674]MDF2140431.1 DUF3576 domain-containing protein [Paenirhodobacter sp. CAU 1674]